jgi:hypothetical protein
VVELPAECADHGLRHGANVIHDWCAKA